MAQTPKWPQAFDPSTNVQQDSGTKQRPLPLRAYSQGEANPSTNIWQHWRRKSAVQVGSRKARLRLNPSANRSDVRSQLATLYTVSESRDNTVTPQERNVEKGSLLTPPTTPPKDMAVDLESSLPSTESVDIIPFDFAKIDYELDRARSVGTGLWSVVYFAQPIVKTPGRTRQDVPSPPGTPRSTSKLPPCSLFAVKTASRPDAKKIFHDEARTLTRLQRTGTAHHYIVPFHGLDERIDSLIFEGVIGGSLESLSRRLKVMTELERHLELRSVFPKIANDLVSGLEFIHNAGIVHADIKPANVLLDVSDHDDQDSLVIRARYIDFSASFIPGQDSAANAGGTWDFMAPEQLRIQKDLNTPTFASDAWSLGVTLLFLIVGASPYSAACGDNMFRLRNSIKSGDPLRFARMDHVVQKRMAACQDFVDCCRLVLQTDRDRRLSASAWRSWLEGEGIL